MYQIYADGNLIYQPANDRLRLISPRLTVEMGKAGSLEFNIPPTNTYYGNLQQLKAILTVTEDGEELFRGRVLSNKKNFNLIRTIYGEGDLSYLIDSVQNPEKFNGKSSALFRKIIEKHNQMVRGSEKVFTVGRITVDDRDVYVAGKSEDITNLETNQFDYRQIVINGEVDNWQTSFDYLESSLIDYCGGYLRTRRDNAAGITYIDWLKDYYSTSSQTISFGRNLLDLTEENNAEEAFSVLIPIGDDNLTINSVNKGSNELVNAEALARYGRIVKTNVFSGVNNATTLLENGRRYLQEHAIPPITFTVTAVDMHLLNPSVQPIRLGDKVHIVSPGHEVDDSNLICTKIEYDLSNPANTRYTFGKPKQSLTERYRQDRKPEQSNGGGGGGAAETAEKASEKNQLDFYKSWVKYDENGGTVDIGSLFTRLYNPDGDPENPIERQIRTGTQLLFNSGPDGSSVDLVSSFKSLEKRAEEIANHAGVNVSTGPNGPEVQMYVQDDKTGDIASIKLNIDYENANKYVVDENGKTHVVYEPKSTIALNSDVLEIKNEIETSINTKLFNLNSEVANIKTDVLNLDAKYGKVFLESGYIDVPGLYSQFIFRGNNEITNHSHSISVVGGKVSIGMATWGEASNSFNIADTTFYKDAVASAAKNVKASGIELRDGMIQKGASRAKVKITLSNGRTQFLTLGLSYYPESGGGGSSPQ